MATIPITLTDTGFPNPFSGTAQDLKNAWLQYLGATVTDGSFIPGQLGGTLPTTNIGLYLSDSGTFRYWNGTQYVPVVTKVGSALYSATLAATITAARTVTLQDKSGTLAYLDDVYNPRNTIILTGTPITLDWSVTFAYYTSISSNITVKSTNSLAGQEMALVVASSGTYTVGFPSTFVWPGGTAPIQTPSGTDLYLLRNIAGTVYGEQIKNLS